MYSPDRGSWWDRSTLKLSQRILWHCLCSEHVLWFVITAVLSSQSKTNYTSWSGNPDKRRHVSSHPSDSAPSKPRYTINDRFFFISVRIEHMNSIISRLHHSTKGWGSCAGIFEGEEQLDSEGRGTASTLRSSWCEFQPTICRPS